MTVSNILIVPKWSHKKPSLYLSRDSMEARGGPLREAREAVIFLSSFPSLPLLTPSLPSHSPSFPPLTPLIPSPHSFSLPPSSSSWPPGRTVAPHWFPPLASSPVSPPSLPPFLMLDPCEGGGGNEEKWGEMRRRRRRRGCAGRGGSLDLCPAGPDSAEAASTPLPTSTTPPQLNYALYNCILCTVYSVFCVHCVNCAMDFLHCSLYCLYRALCMVHRCRWQFFYDAQRYTLRSVMNQAVHLMCSAVQCSAMQCSSL